MWSGTRPPRIEDDREMTVGAQLLAKKLRQNFRLTQVMVAPVHSSQNVLPVFVGNPFEQLPARGIIILLENRVCIVGQSRFVEVHEVAHESDENQIRGMNDGLPHAHDLAVVSRLEVSEPVDTTTGEKYFGGTRRILALQRLAQERVEVKTWVGTQCQRGPPGEGVACLGGATLERHSVE